MYEHHQEENVMTPQSYGTKLFANPWTLKSQVNPDLRNSMRSRETDAFIDPRAMDVATSNPLTEKAPSHFDPKDTIMISKNG